MSCSKQANSKIFIDFAKWMINPLFYLLIYWKFGASINLKYWDRYEYIREKRNE